MAAMDRVGILSFETLGVSSMNGAKSGKQPASICQSPLWTETEGYVRSDTGLPWTNSSGKRGSASALNSQ